MLLSLAIAALSACRQGPESGHWIDQAEVVHRPHGLAQEAASVRLADRWDRRFPGVNGSALYRLTLPPQPPDAPPRWALIERMGNQATVHIDGVRVASLDSASRPDADASHAAHSIHLPAGSRILEIEVKTQALRDGGLGPVLIAPPDIVRQQQSKVNFLRQTIPALYATGLLSMGALAAALWWRERESPYGCFSLAAFAGSMRQIDKILPGIPLPWPIWGALLAVSHGAELALLARFVIQVALPSCHRWLDRLLHTTLALVVLLAASSFAFSSRTPWTAALCALLVLGAVCFAVVIRRTVHTPSKTAAFVLAAGSLLMTMGTHDFLFVRMAETGRLHEPWISHALFFFVVLLVGIVVQRYSRSATAARELSTNLKQRVADREQQLVAAFEALRLRREQETMLHERQRIMRDIHDGVGAHLVGLLHLVRDRNADRDQLERHVTEALDELRMAVDAQQPMHGDLSAVLATLRYRLQPRLQAAGIHVDWDVDALPSLSHLPPRSVLELQRILLEAFTNVIRHAHADRVSVRAGALLCAWPPCVRLTVIDNGIGLAHLDAPPGGGHGLRNMRERARLLGATMRIDRPLEGGTRVTIDWPLDDVNASPVLPTEA